MENSYLERFSPQEFFSPRDGRSGRINRYRVQDGPDRLFAEKTGEVHGVDGGPVRWHGPRTNQGHAVQFLYGEDGGDGAWVEKQKFPHYLGDDQLRKAYSINLAEGRDKQGPADARRCRDAAAACRADPDLETLLEAELID